MNTTGGRPDDLDGANPRGAPEDAANPYAPPDHAAGLSSAAAAGAMDREIVKKFRAQIHALGGFWIFIGSMGLLAAAGAAGLFGDEPRRGLKDIGGEVALAAVLAGLGTAWALVGLLACLKQLWSVYVGLALSYLSLLGQLLSLNVCALVILLVVVLQAHRVIGWAGRMRRAGIPLTTRPEELAG